MESGFPLSRHYPKQRFDCADVGLVDLPAWCRPKAAAKSATIAAMKDLSMEVAPRSVAACLHCTLRRDVFSGAGVDSALMADYAAPK
jgi:hypothetical protein